jgi:hypothetical protein
LKVWENRTGISTLGLLKSAIWHEGAAVDARVVEIVHSEPTGKGHLSPETPTLPLGLVDGRVIVEVKTRKTFGEQKGEVSQDAGLERKQIPGIDVRL